MSPLWVMATCRRTPKRGVLRRGTTVGRWPCGGIARRDTTRIGIANGFRGGMVAKRSCFWFKNAMTESNTLHLPELPAFNADSWESIEGGFDQAALLQIAQMPGAEPSPLFRPGEVRFGWREDQLLVSARLTDEEVLTTASAHNERIWMLGDVFEMFLRDLETEAYAELHVAPNGYTLQLRFPDSHALENMRQRGVTLEDYMLPHPAFESRARLVPDRPGWDVFASVPVETVLGEKKSLPARQWLVSFSRYDVSTGQEKPVLSSTSPHQVVRYHRQQEWRRVCFVN